MLEPTDPSTVPSDAGDPAETSNAGETAASPAAKKTAKKVAKKAAAKKTAATKAPAKKAATKATGAKSTAKKVAAPDADPESAPVRKKAAKKAAKRAADGAEARVEGGAEPAVPPALAAPAVLFQAPAAEPAPRKRPAKKAAKAPAGPGSTGSTANAAVDAELNDVDRDAVGDADDVREAAIEEATGARRRRRRGRRGRGGGGQQIQGDADGDEATESGADRDSASDGADGAEGAGGTGGTDGADGAEGTGGTDGAEGTDGTDGADASGESSSTRRRRRRRRSSGADGGSGDGDGEDPPNTVVHVREGRPGDDGVKGVKGSTRLEAKRQRRRDGRETSRRRPPILTEAEFLARREAVDRVMAVRQSGDRTQIAVLEDDILVEHYVTRASATSYVGNVYLGRVQNVLPSMEAAFVDIGKGRNGVLYAGEVNWDAAGLEGKSRAIEQALKSGDTVLVQVTKDPIGHKGARLTSQISLPGRFLVYVPGGGMTGISRKLPDTERHRLKAILKKIVPEDGGVIVRTAAEGASEEELTRDVERLTAQWEQISKKAAKTSAAPTLVHGEPDLAIRVVRDVFNEDFKKLVVQGDKAWSTVSEYIQGVAPDLADRVSKHTGAKDLFAELRVDEQLMKALDRKVWLPSGGSLVIDRTEAMTVIDVNTGKFVGSGGNLEQTVTRNNLEAAEEIVRQLRLRDVGGIVVIDFIDMVLESNRDLVLRRLTECLGRDRTKHQVAEVTSLGLVQMTRKRVGEGLLEAFSEPCEVCRGRGVIVHTEPVGTRSTVSDEDDRPAGKSKRKRSGKQDKADKPGPTEEELAALEEQRRAAREAISAIHRAAHPDEAVPEPSEERVAEVVAALLEAEPTAADVDIEPTQVAEPTPAAEPSQPTEPSEAAAIDASSDSVGSGEPDAAEAAEPARRPAPRRRRAASRPAGPPALVGGAEGGSPEGAAAQ